MTEQKPTTPDTAPSNQPDETFEWTGEARHGTPSADASAGSAGRDWLAQLQTMIENAATQAAPVMREVAAKAAELAAVAGEKAGPVAARAAELTAEAGHRIAERSRDLAAELRRDQATPAAGGVEASGAGEAAAATDRDAPGA